MRLLQWRPRARRSSPHPLSSVPAIGEFAGRARYVPGNADALPLALQSAIGKIVDVEFAGIALPGPFAGQSLYRECGGQNLLMGEAVPEQDLDFIP
jgi:hypothetical protein